MEQLIRAITRAVQLAAFFELYCIFVVVLPLGSVYFLEVIISTSVIEAESVYCVLF